MGRDEVGRETLASVRGESGCIAGDKEGGVWNQLDELNRSQKSGRFMHPALGWQLWNRWSDEVGKVSLERRKQTLTRKTGQASVGWHEKWPRHPGLETPQIGAQLSDPGNGTSFICGGRYVTKSFGSTSH